MTATTRRMKSVRLWMDPADVAALRRVAAAETLRTGRPVSFASRVRRALRDAVERAERAGLGDAA